jgi:predicted phosphodiesterase
MWGVGAALSNIIAGWIVVAAGYDTAFISLGVFAAAGLALYGHSHARNRAQRGQQRRVNPGRRPPPNGGDARVGGR